MRRSLPPSAFHPSGTDFATPEPAAGTGRRPRRFLLLWVHSASAELPSVADAGAPAWTRSVVYARDTLTGQVHRLEVLSRRPPSGPPDDGEPPALAAALRFAEEPAPPEDLPVPVRTAAEGSRHPNHPYGLTPDALPA